MSLFKYYNDGLFLFLTTQTQHYCAILCCNFKRASLQINKRTEGFKLIEKMKKINTK